MGAVETAGLMRLLQIADSAFPVGGFAYSHGLEWMAHEGLVRDDEGVATFLEGYVAQAVLGQSVPGALRGWRAASPGAAVRADVQLDASMATSVERDAGRAMGERLLVESANAFGGERARLLLTDVKSGRSPGQYAVAFGVVAREQGVEDRAMAVALAYTMIAAVAQAGVRLGLIGQGGSARVTAAACAAAERKIAAIVSARRVRRPGAFAPGSDVAGVLHSRLPFRMFAS